MEQPYQKIGRGHLRADKLHRLDGVEKQVGAGPVVALIPVEKVVRPQQPALAAAAFGSDEG